MSKFAKILKDVFATKAYAARTYTSDPLQSFRYRVVFIIDGRDNIEMGFKKVGGLSKEIAVSEYVENVSDAITQKIPGRATVGEITFEKGMFANKSLYDEFKTLLNGDTRFSTNVTILKRNGESAKTFSLFECWFSKWELADLDASSDDVLVETLTMQCERLDDTTI